MGSISGFRVVERLYESRNSIVYRAEDERDGQRVVIKMLEEDYPSPERIGWFRREYEITRSLADLSGVIEARGLHNEQNRWFMVLEDFGGASLSRRLKRERFHMDEVLAMASSLIDTIGQVHRRHVIHKDINPSNVVYSAETGRVKLIDFGISSLLAHESAVPHEPNRLEGTLAYISPEQTGRMNRSIDYRTDFYSLGVTLYELLTGRLPFESTDPLELLHAHLARRPVPPDELDAGVDKALSDIVMKLLAKNAEDRYRSAHGLARDIEEYRSRRREGRVASFPLGSFDVADRLQVAQRLYGRERDSEILLSAFERAAGGGREVMLVSGYSGVGKTSLIREIYRPVTRRHGYFASGKFDQLVRDVPYSSLLQALRGLMAEVLSETEEQIAAWRREMMGAVGPNGRLITDVIPEAEVIIGPQPPVPELEPKEAQSRFHSVVTSFIRVFANREHPLVLFIDDLQWADGASLSLLQSLLSGEGQYLFFIGAYRDTEVSDAHPLMLHLAELRRGGVTIHEIALSPLRVEHVTQLLSDTLERDPSVTAPLARLAHAKTAGNPFFLIEFLKHLSAEGLIRFDYRSGAWEWSLNQIEARGVTDNVVTLMAGKVQRLSPTCQEALKLAACMGSTFDLETLALISERTQREAAAALQEALTEELILPLSESYKLTDLDVEGLLDSLSVEYRFAHDRIQQAAYSLIAEESRRVLHWKVGKRLLEKIRPEELEQRIFDVVNQLSNGLDEARDRAERDELAGLYLLAGRKAKMSAAYAPALHYLRLGIDLLCEPRSGGGALLSSTSDVREAWERRYGLSLDLFDEAAEAACLIGDYEVARELTDVTRDLARSMTDKLRSYKVEIQSYAARDQLTEGVAAGRRALALLGIEIPEAPTFEDIGAVAAEVTAAWAGRDIDSLIHLPEMTDPTWLAAMEIMARLYIPAFNGAPSIFVLIVLHEVLLSIRHGVASSSARGFEAYGFILCAQGQIPSGYEFGRLALRFVDRFGGKDRSSIVFMFNFFVRHWREGLRETVPAFLESYQLGLDNGDLDFAALSLIGIVCQSFWCGKELSALAAEAAMYGRTIRHLKQELPQETNDIFWQTTLNLLGQSDDPCMLIGEALDERQKLPFYIGTNNVTETAFFHLNKLVLTYLFGRYERAVEHAREAEKCLAGISGMMGTAVFYFYDALASLARCEGGEQDRLALDRAEAGLARLRAWTEHAPMNFEHKACLVAAERARVLGDAMAARDLYDRAIALAKEHRFLAVEALAYELAGRFHRDHGYGHLARNYLRDARYAYEQWGATAKVKQLEERFPRDLGRAAPRSLVGELSTKGGTDRLRGAAGALDLLSVLKASQALSGEIVLESLLAKLLSTVIETAGAQKAILLLEENGELVIEAEGVVDGPSIKVLQSIPMSRSENLLHSIVYLVARRGRPEVVNDASLEGMFVDELYVQQRRPKSILCVPLMNQGKLTGILYLENNLIAGAFTYDRTEVLNLLSAEMAIAIDNARLYRELQAANSALAEYSHTLEDRVAERTQELAAMNLELHQALEKLRATQEQLILREKMASLGEVTAGIAHEIRNPLNFIYNFAQLSTELADELKEELAAWSEQPDSERLRSMKALIQDLHKNASQIERHGARANNILNGMLLHTRGSGAERVTVDLNELMSQSIELSYQALLARSAASKIELIKAYNSDVGAVKALPEELTRAFMNIIENACYSVLKKSQQAGGAYAPRVWVSTKSRAREVEVVIRDNGLGIAKEHFDKIFNPFFTTKPAGEGTGLGLSISYDIVVRKHQGDIRVDAKEGEYTEFIVVLPRDPSQPRGTPN